MRIVLHEEMLDLFLGKLIGQGQNRDVYEFGLELDSLVVKIEERGTDFQNTREWNIWKAAENTKHAKWFAPCRAISANGRILIQDKVVYPDKSSYPKMMPQFFDDFKYKNFGKLNNKWVCNDYGFIHPVSPGRIDKMVKVRWWDE